MKKFFIILTLIALAAISLLISCSTTVNVALYFALPDGNEVHLSKEMRNIEATAELYKKVVEELIKGPGDQELYPTLPSNVKVNYVKLDGDTAIVDLSREILTNTDEIPHSSTTETLAIFSIVNSLTEFEEVKKVKITIEGREEGQIDGFSIQDFWGHLGIYEEFTRNQEIING